MRTLKIIAIVILIALPLFAGEVTLDRVLVLVNGSPLLQSDLDDVIRFEALQSGVSVKEVESHKADAFDRLIERELIHQEMRAVYDPTAAEIAQQIQGIRSQFPNASDDQEWQKILSSYGFDKADLQTAVTRQLQTLRFLDIRLRPEIQVDRRDIEAYYREHLVPELKARGASPEPLNAVSPKIEELLVQRKMNEVFAAWMANLRTQSKIQVLDSILGSTQLNGKLSSGMTESR